MKEQLYNDFVVNVLPKLQEGLTISYEYFLDLFGRYVKYLFITDIISSILFSSISIVIILCLRSKGYRAWFKEANDDYNPFGMMSLAIGCIATLSFIVFAIDSAFDAIKAKYIPEVRVYEEIQLMRSTSNN